jgi:type VI secretion system protein ImpM
VLTPFILPPGAFGKLPAHGDFIRINAGDPVAQHLAVWLQAGFESVIRVNAALPATPTPFVLSLGANRNSLVGALVPSKDRVGREFPLAVFVPVESSLLATRFPLVPFSFSRFICSVGALLAETATISAAKLQAELARLPLPAPSDWSFAEEQRRLQLDTSSANLMKQFSEPEANGLHYAARTFLMACSAERGQEPAKARVVLDCPIVTDGPLPWLEFAARILGWKAQPPSFMWTEAEPRRLLLALGPIPAAALGYLSRPDRPVAVFWPLKTTQKAAMDAAREALSEEQRRTLEDGQSSLETLFTSLAR